MFDTNESHIWEKQLSSTCFYLFICLHTLEQIHVFFFFSPFLCGSLVSLRRPMWLINQLTTFLLFYRPFDLWWMFHFRSRSSPLMVKGSVLEKLCWGFRVLFFLFLRLGLVLQARWRNARTSSEFKSDLLFVVIRKRESVLLLLRLRMRRRQETLWGLFPRRRGSTSRFTPGWSFQTEKVFILSPRSSLGPAAIAALNCEASPCPHLLCSFRNLTQTKSAFSPSTWASAPGGRGAAAPELMGLCRWQRS